MLNYMYLPDTDQDSKDNLREFIEQLHDGGMEGEMQSDALKDFVYQAIKKFAEGN